MQSQIGSKAHASNELSHGLAVFAVSSSAALAAKKTTKPKAPPAAAAAGPTFDAPAAHVGSG